METKERKQNSKYLHYFHLISSIFDNLFLINIINRLE